ncbi:MAG: N4-(beta-N-acetylglucosaminyl)-L-asparaginase [Pirellulaceae bacterium]|jgi:N4-(beta-N-acetylglucosaminyl)-L-asparaginase
MNVFSQSPRPMFVSTWKFGQAVNQRAMRVAMTGGALLDAIEQGIWVAEDDVHNESVGRGGIPNSEGVMQLDACIMSSDEHRVGAVCAVEDILHPISVARKVMEETPHVMLAGNGAREFALTHGFRTQDLLTSEQHVKWQQWQKSKEAGQVSPNPGHDTIALLGLAYNGELAGGCSTSGWGYKLPGRVGDSPIVGGGLYIDEGVGAAAATGRGENIMRYCGSFMIVENMRRGASPEQACIQAIRYIARKDPRGYDLDIHFIAINREGEYGAAGTGKGFPFCVISSQKDEVMQSVAINATSAFV